MKSKRTGEPSFKVYEHYVITENEERLKFCFIVLADDDGIITKWTDFHKYAASGRLRSSSGDTAYRYRYAVRLLNYCFFQEYHIRRLADMTAEMVKQFLTRFAMCTLPGDDQNTCRSRNTVTACINSIIDFVTNLKADHPGCAMDLKRLYRTKEKFNRKKGRYEDIKVLDFDIQYRNSKKQEIFRDMPEKVFEIVFNEIYANHKDILMLVALQAFAGLRPSEACNVRRIDSKLGPGLTFEYVDGRINNVYIDLTRELNLRSDFKPVGKIKKERTQKVYDKYLQVFVQCYEEYMRYMEGRKYENQYGALTVNLQGKAMTYHSYRQKFQQAVSDCIPRMLSSDDAETVLYGNLLLENSVAPHIFRHWFTVRLVLDGLDASQIMYWRGDKSIESSLTYLQNKGDLEKEFAKVADGSFSYLLRRAEVEHDGLK